MKDMNKNTNEPKIDYEAIFGDIQWDLDKAKYLLLDIQSFFETADPEYPTRENIEGIKYEYKHIVVMLGLLDDLIKKMTDTVTPLA